MKKLVLLATFIAMSITACDTARENVAAEAAGDRIVRAEPLSWWVGMRTPLQLMVQGKDISSCEVEMARGTRGVRVTATHKADNADFLFIDIDIAPDAAAGEYEIIFTRGEERFVLPYRIDSRREGSAARQSFTTADMIYLLMPDRFANGDPANDATEDTREKPDRAGFFSRHGGDIQGMIDHLDYIASTGATAIWSTPLLLDDEPHGSYHGYACADYYHIDPRFGSNELYRTFVAESHRRGLKVIMDIVTNHCGSAHWWMRDMPFEDWVHRFPQYTRTNNLFSTNMDPNASHADLEIQESGWFDRSMPDMNLDNPYLLQYFKQWAVWWIEYADLDGLRVDTYPYNEKEPMSEWCRAVREEYPDINIVGECWTGNIPQLAYWQGGNANRDGFDSHLPSIMDFPLRDAICEALSGDSLREGRGMSRVYETLSNDFVYHDLSHMMIFTANHDTDRIGDVVRRNPDRMKLSMTLLATMRGIPQIFAGDEMMFTSKDRSQGHGGLRVDFPGGWEGDEVSLFDAAQRDSVQQELFDYTRRLFEWRKGKKVIHSGRTLHFAPRGNTYAYFRYDDTHNGRNVLTGEAFEPSDSTRVGARQALIVEFERR